MSIHTDCACACARVHVCMPGQLILIYTCVRRARTVTCNHYVHERVSVPVLVLVFGWYSRELVRDVHLIYI